MVDADQIVDRVPNSGSQEKFREMMAMVAGPLGNPIHNKMNEGHISSVLDLAAKHDEREFQLAKGEQNIRSSSRWIELVVFLVIVAVFLVSLWMFKENPEHAIKIAGGLLTFAAGFGSGW